MTHFPPLFVQMWDGSGSAVETSQLASSGYESVWDRRTDKMRIQLYPTVVATDSILVGVASVGLWLPKIHSMPRPHNTEDNGARATQTMFAGRFVFFKRPSSTLSILFPVLSAFCNLPPASSSPTKVFLGKHEDSHRFHCWRPRSLHHASPDSRRMAESWIPQQLAGLLHARWRQARHCASLS